MSGLTRRGLMAGVPALSVSGAVSGAATEIGPARGETIGTLNTPAAGENLFPNSQWQLTTALGPGWNGRPQDLRAHLDAFDTEWNWLYTGNLPAVKVDGVEVEVDSSSGQSTMTIHAGEAIQYLRPDAVVTFDAQAPEALTLSPMRVRTIDYQAATFTLLPPRNKAPRPGAVRCACRSVMRADLTGVTGHGPDGWSKSTTARLWIDRWSAVPRPGPKAFFHAGASAPNRPAWSSSLRASMKRCVVFSPADDAPAKFFHAMTDFASLRGRRLVMGMWLQRVGRAGPAGGWSGLFIDDGEERRSTASVAGDDWTWIETSKVIAADADRLSLGFLTEGGQGQRWRIAEPMLALGDRLGSRGYRRPKGRLDRFVVKMTPDAWFGAEVDFGPRGGACVDFAGETALAISEDVPLVMGQLEGTAERAGQPLFTRSAHAAPHRYGPGLHSVQGGRPVTTSGTFDLADDGTLWLFSEHGARWQDISFDLDQAVLW